MPRKKLIDCPHHGKRAAAVICGHMIASKRIVGFVEHDPLQAWCDDCEAMYRADGEKTPAFVAFNDRRVVCAKCYAEYKARHTLKG
jgi:hypothetical protein